MSAKEKRIERSQRFKRAWRGENRKKAVSPVVATLILILIAVAAAAALYLWLVAWQGGVTGGIGSPTAQYTVSIGGSTSVYPFAEIAATQFEQNNSDVVVSVNQGGSGAGMAAVCSGQVNIGEASAPYTATTLETSDGCPTTVVQETVAYDGVDVIVQGSDATGSNTVGLLGIDQTTMLAIYVAEGGGATAFNAMAQSGYSQGIAFSASTPYTFPTTVPASDAASCGTVGAPIATCPIDVFPGGAAGYVWDQIPACVPQQTVAEGCSALQQFVGTGAGGTSCYWTVCAGGASEGTAAIVTYERSDVSGTQQSFTSRILGISASAAASTGLGFTGCGSDGQLSSCGLSETHGENGNPALISAVAGSAAGIGFASDGLAQASGSGVTPVSFEGLGQPTVVKLSGGTSTSLAAIALGIAGNYVNSGGTASTGYVGWRPFINVETAPPTGEELRYLEYVMDPANNENFAAQAAEISVYASGLAGHVPVTPIP
jgi:flagellin-like protein